MQTEVRFRLAGGAQPLVIVPASVNGDGPHQFILDTGAGVSLLTPEFARRLNVAVTGSKEGAGAGGKVTVSLGTVESLSVGQARVENLQVGITDELSRIGAAIGAKIDGNIGYNYLKAFRLTLDYQKQTLQLARAGQEGDGTQTRAGMKFKLAHTAKPLILVPVFLNGAGPYIFALDTGASTTVLSHEVAQIQGIKTTAIPNMTGAGGTMKGAVGVVNSLALGEARREQMQVVISDFLEMLGKIVATKLDGIIGYNYLKEFRVTIDYPNETLRLE
ncbi:MAG TPA: aspartyl protease family protein [Pyrinomonadaceae bacterium]